MAAKKRNGGKTGRKKGSAREAASVKAESPSLVPRVLALVVVALVAALLILQWQRVRQRMTASRALLQIEQKVNTDLSRGQLDPAQLRAQLELLRSVEPLDPSDFGIKLAIGSHYYLLREPLSAIRFYEEAAELELRPEILVNLSRAWQMEGNEQKAQELLERAKQLDPSRFQD